MTGTIKRFADVPQLTRNGSYRITVPWNSIDRTLSQIGEPHGIDLDPDFQRGHVWTDEQRIRYVEYVLRGGVSSREILFNQSGWQSSTQDRGEPTTLVDGKQRLQAVRMFVSGEIPAFGSFIHEFEDELSMTSHNFSFTINDLPTREEVLQWYLDLNDGGIAHAKEEIDRVRDLLAQERSTSAPAPR